MLVAGTEGYRNLVDDLLSVALEKRPDVIEMFSYYRSLSPSRLNERRFFTEVCWIGYSSGFRYDIVRKYWPKIREALYDFDVHRVAADVIEIRDAEERICEVSGFRNRSKASWCVVNAKRITDLEEDWKGIGGIKGFFEKLARDSLVNQVRSAPTTVQELGLKGIGETTIFHLMKNVGVDVFKPDIHIRRLLARMGLVSSETAPIEQVCRAMTFLSEASGYRVTQIDTILFAYGMGVGDFLPSQTPRAKNSKWAV